MEDSASIPPGRATPWAHARRGSHAALSLFMDMDKLVGSDFEKGLASMKAAAERAAAPK